MGAPAFAQGPRPALTGLNNKPPRGEADGLPTWASIEIMAQTVSAYSGWLGQQKQQSPKVGFLLGTRKLHLPVAYFALGQTLKIRVEQQYLHEGLGQFSCEIHYEDHVIHALLSVYEPTDQSVLKR